ncbi:MAG: hypothetical protein LBV34_04180, partial [Nocardiopsaceae bacterium]|nr:hypothetical protein [Nocardiopsaceae bacterium]
VAQPEALTSGFRYALAACSLFLVAAAAIASRTRSTRGGSTTAGQAAEGKSQGGNFTHRLHGVTARRRPPAWEVSS